jgi:hypothetical protein
MVMFGLVAWQRVLANLLEWRCAVYHKSSSCTLFRDMLHVSLWYTELLVD